MEREGEVMVGGWGVGGETGGKKERVRLKKKKDVQEGTEREEE